MTDTVPTSSQALVLEEYPNARSEQFTGSHDWEIYDGPGGTLLGSGVDLVTTFEQDEVDYKSTEDAAWDDAWRNLVARRRYRDLAREILDMVAGDVRAGSDLTEDYLADAVARKVLDGATSDFFFDLRDKLAKEKDHFETRKLKDPMWAVFNRVPGGREFVTVAFTREYARLYIAFNWKEMTDPFVEPFSATHNVELSSVRRMLETL